MTQRSLTDHESGLKTLLIRRTYASPPDSSTRRCRRRS
jgi:hypothetical protein